MKNVTASNDRIISKIDSFLVYTFKGLIEFILAILGFVLIAVLPIVFFTMSGASLLSGEWLMGLLYLLLMIVSFYSARGLTELLKNTKDSLNGAVSRNDDATMKMEMTPEQKAELDRLAGATTINPQHAQAMADASIAALNKIDPEK